MFKKSIFTKIFLLVISVSFIVGMLILTVFIKERTKDIEKAIIQENKILGEIAGSIIETAYLEEILPFQTLEKIAKAENINFLWIVKPNGEIYYADDPEMFNKIIRDSSLGTKKIVIKDSIDPKTGEKIKLMVFPLKMDISEKPWNLYLGVSLKEISLAQKKIILHSLFLFILALIFIFFVSFYFSREITLPLEKLKKGTEIIGKGNLDYRIDIKTGDEIEQLAEEFNRMAESLKRSHDVLEEAKTVLEIKVAARTRELRELVESLDEKVKERTKELQEKIEELEKVTEEKIIFLIREKALRRDVERKVKELEEARTALVHILEDVEIARAKAEEEKNKTLAIITNFADGLLVFDNENKLSLINPQAEKFFDIKSEGLIGRSVLELSTFPKLELLMKLLGEKEIKEVYREELQVKENLILEVSTVPIIRKNEKTGTLVILHDVTREKIIEKMKSEFVSIAAHQLRTPLSAIKWTLQMVLDGDLGELNDEQKDFLNKAYQSNERMINLVNDLLDAARIEEGRYVYKPIVTEFEPIVQSMIDFYKEEIEKKNIQFEFIKPEENLPKVMVDVEKIKLAIQNLLDNAIKYTPFGGKITVTLKRNEKEIEFSVKDSGIGIPKNQKERVFTKFFRGDNAIKMETEGSGLGLFITKNIITAHNGKIWFESEEGKGTTFYFTLPIVE